MRIREVRQHVEHVEQIIHRAAQACASDDAAPEQLKQCLYEFDRKSHQAEQTMQGEPDDNSIRQCIDDLEAVGDRAKQACRQPGVSSEVKDAVMQAHTELSRMKRQLH